MAQQSINRGSSPNDGTGDPLRTAFGKANDNFTELYAQESWQRLQPTFTTDFLLNQVTQGEFLGGAISSGTAAVGTVVANHPGMVAMSSAASINSGYRFVTGANAILIAGGEQFDVVFLTPPALSAVAYRFGLLDTINSSDATDGAYFQLINSGDIIGKTSNNTTQDSTSTIATLAVDTWYHARIKVNAAASQVDFTIYSDAGSSLGTASLTAHIPTGAGRFVGAGFVATTTGGSAIVLATLDYMALKFTKAMTRGFAS